MRGLETLMAEGKKAPAKPPRSDFERGYRHAIAVVGRLIRATDWAKPTEKRMRALVRLTASFAKQEARRDKDAR